MAHETMAIVRRSILALLTLVVLAMTVDLLLLGHYEDRPQLIPLVLNVAAVAVIVWHFVTASRSSVRTMQALMIVFVAAGCVGIYLHFRGNLEFQLDINPSAGHWELFKKVIQAKAPPALAPGAMAQVGLLGLIYSYRHPALDRISSADNSDTGRTT